MKPSGIKYFAIALQIIMLGACAPQATPSPVATETATPPLASIDLAGPKMEVGSRFLYADGTVLVAVPGGIFPMGGGGSDNLVHPVNVSDFWIYSTKVTNGQFSFCVAMGLCTAPLRADNPTWDDPALVSDPMVGVTYDQALAYCTFTNSRLPTEAEWEKTARGPDGNIYPWGDGAPSCDLLNYGICVGKTTPVNAYAAGESYYHALDMEGNALEWVADKYQPDYFSISPADNPRGPDKGRDRVVRGSAFNSGGDQTPAFIRLHSSPDTHRDNLGFRCVVDDPTYFAPFCNYPATFGTTEIGGSPSDFPPDVVCPDLTIDQDPQCNGHSPTTHVTMPGDSPVIPSTCTADNQHPGEYDCTGAGTLVACDSCEITPKSAPICPDGYDYDETTEDCVSQTQISGNCLPGYTPVHVQHLDHPMLVSYLPTPAPSAAAGECCAFTPPKVVLGNGNVDCETDANGVKTCHTPFSGCPVGTSFLDGVCVGGVIVQGFCNVEGVALNSCEGGGGDPLVCPGVVCGQNYALNPSTCQCDCAGC